MAREETFPLRIARLLNPDRQHFLEAFCGRFRRIGACTLADKANDGMAIADIVVQGLEQRDAVWPLPEVALDGDVAAARP